MIRKLAGILVILCIAGLLIVAGVRFAVPAGTLPAGPAVTPSPETPTVTLTPETPAPGGNVTEAEAKTIAAAALPEIIRTETAKVRLEHIQDGQGERRLFDVSDSSVTRQAQVWVDARTGEVTGFAIHVPNLAGRPINPVITMAEACVIAEELLADRGETADLAAAVGKYYSPYTNERTGETVAGFYAVKSPRIVRNIPCARDGCWVDVDSVTGEVRRYDRFRDLDAARCKGDTEPAITAEEAEAGAAAYLRETYGELAGLTFRSATLVWAENLVPATDEVPLAWQIPFDDDYYRSLDSPRTDIAFVDARNGTVLSCNYRRDTA